MTSLEHQTGEKPSTNFSESRFWKHLGWFILLKICCVFALWYAFFGPGHRMKPDAEATQFHITGKP